MSARELAKRKGMPVTKAESDPDVPVFIPKVDILEKETEITVIADMPGVDEKSLNIDLEGNNLRVFGRSEAVCPEGYSRTYSEYSRGVYEREFTLGSTIDRKAITAVVEQGVLRLILPKREKAQPRRIPVKAG